MYHVETLKECEPEWAPIVECIGGMAAKKKEMMKKKEKERKNRRINNMKNKQTQENYFIFFLSCLPFFPSFVCFVHFAESKSLCGEKLTMRKKTNSKSECFSILIIIAKQQKQQQQSQTKLGESEGMSREKKEENHSSNTLHADIYICMNFCRYATFISRFYRKDQKRHTHIAHRDRRVF